MAFEGSIDLYHVDKRYGDVPVLHDVNLKISPGEFVVVCGSSGAGKTTLLRLVYGDENATSGQVCVDGKDVGKLSRSNIQALRRRMGIVFQTGRLLEDKSVFENLEFIVKAFHLPRLKGRKRALQVLRLVGLQRKVKCLVGELSGGEKQRLAVARALINGPSIILADEPTAHLDRQVASEIMEILSLISQLGPTILVATHDIDAVSRLETRNYELVDGQLKRLDRKMSSA